MKQIDMFWRKAPMRKQTAKQGAAFKAAAEVALRAIGAVDHQHGGLYIATRYGGLRLHPSETAIRTCFDKVPSVDPAGAHLNPYSGKWNFEFGFKPTSDDLDAALKSIKGVL